MSRFTLAISCLTDHFQFALIHGPDIPGCYAILVFTASDLASITSHIHNWVLFLLWPHPFILLELFLHWSSVTYWALTDLGSSSFSILSFCLFILFMGFSRQEYCSGLPFPSPVDHVLSVCSSVLFPRVVCFPSPPPLLLCLPSQSLLPSCQDPAPTFSRRLRKSHNHVGEGGCYKAMDLVFTVLPKILYEILPTISPNLLFSH